MTTFNYIFIMMIIIITITIHFCHNHHRVSSDDDDDDDDDDGFLTIIIFHFKTIFHNFLAIILERQFDKNDGCIGVPMVGDNK